MGKNVPRSFGWESKSSNAGPDPLASCLFPPRSPFCPPVGGLKLPRKPPPGGPPCLFRSPGGGSPGAEIGAGVTFPGSLLTRIGDGSKVTGKYPFGRKYLGKMPLCYGGKPQSNDCQSSLSWGGDRLGENFSVWSTEHRQKPKRPTHLQCACLQQNFLLTGEGRVERSGNPKYTFHPQINLICQIPMW